MKGREEWGGWKGGWKGEASHPCPCTNVQHPPLPLHNRLTPSPAPTQTLNTLPCACHPFTFPHDVAGPCVLRHACTLPSCPLPHVRPPMPCSFPLCHGHVGALPPSFCCLPRLAALPLSVALLCPMQCPLVVSPASTPSPHSAPRRCSADSHSCTAACAASTAHTQPWRAL